MEQFRQFDVRLKEFCELKGYKLIADTGDYVMIEDEKRRLIKCDGYRLHLAMLKANIR